MPALGYPPRLAIRDRIVDVLHGKTAALDRVRMNLTRRQLERMLEAGPVIRVYLFQEAGEKDGEAPHNSKRVLDVAVHLTALADENVDDVLERLSFDIETRLFTDRLLNGEPLNVDGAEIWPVAAGIEFARMTLAPDEETGFGHHLTVYQAAYYTDQPDGGTLDDFRTADVETHPADGTAETPPAHDRLTLPQ